MKQRNEGFSAIELAILVAIVGIAATTVLGAQNSLERSMENTVAGNCFVKIPDHTWASQIADSMKKHPEFGITTDDKGELYLKRKNCGR